ncbi:ArnT family glycosyltransferase [Crocinitomix catalasitica]|uniref:ArnT family glycosyltransferase n=1 Tax=Crocinitomix catalasitica TaxID=184607 RepID=UPI0004876123|nr:glycosyltransferase family 39 protein [Crocinitomix catalasitica]
MANQIWIGISVLLVCLILSILIWFNFKKKRFHLTLWLVLLLGVLLRIVASTDSQLHLWDERYHALVAKNLIEHPLTPTLHENLILEHDDANWVGGHIWTAKPIFPLWIMAGSIQFFGNNLLAIRLPSVILSLLAIWLTFLIGKKLFNERVGLIAAYLHAINGLIIELTGGRVSSDHVEMCFIVLVELGIVFALNDLFKQPQEKKRNWLFFAGLVTGLAFISKWYPALLVFPVWLIGYSLSDDFNWKSLLKKTSVFFLGLALTALPWTLYMLFNYPDEMFRILFNALFAYSETVEDHSAPFYYYLYKLPIIFGEAIYFVLGFFIYRQYKVNSKTMWIILAWIGIPLLIFSLAETKRFTYILIAAPAFFIATAYLINYLLELLPQKKSKVWIGLALLVLILLPWRYAIERTKMFGNNEELTLFYKMEKTEWSRLNDKTIVFGTDDYIEMMFHTDVHAAYRKMPNLELYNELLADGFVLLTIDELKFIPLSTERINNF